MNRAFPHIALLAMLALIAAACTESSGEETTSTTAPPATTTTTTTSTTTTTTSTTTTTTTVPAPPPLNSSSRMSTHGVGPVKVGMTVEEAEAAAGLDLVGEPDPTVSPDCYFVRPATGLEGLSFMVFEDTIGRAEVDAPSSIQTLSGAGIGTTEEELLALFPDQLEEEDEVGGRVLIFVPADEIHEDFRVVFEMGDDDDVTGMRSGVVPPVLFEEGCV